MIFVTVGTQGPFDRLVDAVDRWAAETGRSDVLAQVGPSSYQPRAIEVVETLGPDAFDSAMRSADLIVAHAGIGTILGAISLGTPLLVMPRRAALGEQRSDHQVATVRRFAERGLISAAIDETDLRHELDHLEELSPSVRRRVVASPELIEHLRAFVVAPG